MHVHVGVCSTSKLDNIRQCVCLVARVKIANIRRHVASGYRIKFKRGTGGRGVLGHGIFSGISSGKAAYVQFPGTAKCWKLLYHGL